MHFKSLTVTSIFRDRERTASHPSTPHGPAAFGKPLPASRWQNQVMAVPGPVSSRINGITLKCLRMTSELKVILQTEVLPCSVGGTDGQWGGHHYTHYYNSGERSSSAGEHPMTWVGYRHQHHLCCHCCVLLGTTRHRLAHKGPTKQWEMEGEVHFHLGKRHILSSTSRFNPQL